MIYFIRHGQTDWNINRCIQGTTDVPLNAVGRAQARALCPEMQALKLDKIITSDLKRAWETAEILNQEIQVPIITDNRLREIHFGQWEGRSVSDLSDSVWHQFFRHPEQVGSEPLTEAFERIKSFFDTTDLSRNTLIVTHSGALRIIAYYLNYPDAKIFDFERYVPYARLSFRNTSLLSVNKDGQLAYLMPEAV